MIGSSDQKWRTVGGEAVPSPSVRRLRGYAFDPSLSTSLDTALVNTVVFRVRWEDSFDMLGPDDPATSALGPGPVGEYLEVIDFDPASGCYYDPVDLNSVLVLAQDGLDPAEGNPQFHQQMVYAVAMTTIHHFEAALGRPALWAAQRAEVGSDDFDAYVQRLRIYPHALREANAYYSPTKKALLFGYFPAEASTVTTDDSRDGHFPGGWVFTCLSHDVIAHETTHALLDGMHRRYIEPTHPDNLAFHEAFADLVALFQHFTFPEVLRHQIARTRGNLTSQNLLGQLAQQFGTAVGKHGALRDAIGSVVDGKWVPSKPDPNAITTTFEPHARGAILVAAVFDAFLAVYSNRVADLLRIATSGTGVLPDGDLHPDLVNRLADEAAKAATHVLRICIRALDYCPPLDITFGDFLRAVITADSDLVPSDTWSYRVAFIEAFRRRGIYPRDVRTLSVDNLRWSPPLADLDADQKRDVLGKIVEVMKDELGELRNYTATREQYFRRSQRLAAELHGIMTDKARYDTFGTYLRQLLGDAVIITDVDSYSLPGLKRADGMPVFEVHSVRPAERIGPDGNRLNHAVMVLTQSREVDVDMGGRSRKLKFRGGCTLVFDLDTFELKYVIAKPIGDDRRLARQLEFARTGRIADLRTTYFASDPLQAEAEPFAMLHQPFDTMQPTVVRPNRPPLTPEAASQLVDSLTKLLPDADAPRGGGR